MKKFSILIVATFFLLSLIILITKSTADELHVWEDEKGIANITTHAPDRPAKIIHKEPFKPNSPAEIRRFQKEQEEYLQRQEAIRRYNEQMEVSKKRYNRQMDQQKENTKLRMMERKQAAIERIEDLEARKERLQAIENKDYNEVRRLQIKDKKRKADRDIQKYREISD
jgi:hypothetical protein